MALLETAPVGMSTLFPTDSELHHVFDSVLTGTKSYIKTTLVSIFQKHAERRVVSAAKSSRLIFIESPLSGGIPVSHVAQLQNRNQQACVFEQFGIGIINPGRCGLSSLGGESVLWWRLWDIANAATQRDLKLVVLSSPRLPPGTRLPAGYPYVFEGVRNGEWASIGVLIAPEIVSSLQILEDYGCDRVLWLRCMQKPPLPSWAIAAIYAPTGGDAPFWDTLLSERKRIMRQFNISRTIIAGDGNTHLKTVVSHSPGCRCGHCKQSAVDRSIERMLTAEGLWCANPVNSSTHVTGTIVDVFITERGGAFGDVVVDPPSTIAASDHSLVHTLAPLTTNCSYAAGFGRVLWTSSPQWSATLGLIDPALHSLSKLVEQVADTSGLSDLARLRSHQNRRRTFLRKRKKTRRKVEEGATCSATQRFTIARISRRAPCRRTRSAA